MKLYANIKLLVGTGKSDSRVTEGDHGSTLEGTQSFSLSDFLLGSKTVEQRPFPANLLIPSQSDLPVPTSGLMLAYSFIGMVLGMAAVYVGTKRVEFIMVGQSVITMFLVINNDLPNLLLYIDAVAIFATWAWRRKRDT